MPVGAICPVWLHFEFGRMTPFSPALSHETRMLNRVAQGRLPFADAVRWFKSLPETEQPGWLEIIAFMCHQSHPQHEEIDPAIELAELKPTLTPCVMVRSAARPEHALERIAELPVDERQKAFRLMFALYCIADTRRRQTQCKNGCSHEWHNFDTVAPAPEQNGSGGYAREDV